MSSTAGPRAWASNHRYPRRNRAGVCRGAGSHPCHLDHHHHQLQRRGQHHHGAGTSLLQAAAAAPGSQSPRTTIPPGQRGREIASSATGTGELRVIPRAKAPIWGYTSKQHHVKTNKKHFRDHNAYMWKVKRNSEPSFRMHLSR